MKVLSIPIPDTLPQALKMSDDEFSQEARILLAAKLYELGAGSSSSRREPMTLVCLPQPISLPVGNTHGGGSHPG